VQGTGKATVADYGWWAGAVGVGVVVSALNDAWEQRFPYCMAVGPPNHFLKGCGRGCLHWVVSGGTSIPAMEVIVDRTR
jgi:hypothetical protein